MIRLSYARTMVTRKPSVASRLSDRSQSNNARRERRETRLRAIAVLRRVPDSEGTMVQPLRALPKDFLRLGVVVKHVAVCFPIGNSHGVSLVVANRLLPAIFRNGGDLLAPETD